MTSKSIIVFLAGMVAGETYMCFVCTKIRKVREQRLRAEEIAGEEAALRDRTDLCDRVILIATDKLVSQLEKVLKDGTT